VQVLFLVEPIVEVAITNLQSYKDKKFVDISKEDLDLGKEFTISCKHTIVSSTNQM
jgi:HSP90 family molecular chaperone